MPESRIRQVLSERMPGLTEQQPIEMPLRQVDSIAHVLNCVRRLTKFDSDQPERRLNPPIGRTRVRGCNGSGVEGQKTGESMQVTASTQTSGVAEKAAALTDRTGYQPFDEIQK